MLLFIVRHACSLDGGRFRVSLLFVIRQSWSGRVRVWLPIAVGVGVLAIVMYMDVAVCIMSLLRAILSAVVLGGPLMSWPVRVRVVALVGLVVFMLMRP